MSRPTPERGDPTRHDFRQLGEQDAARDLIRDQDDPERARLRAVRKHESAPPSGPLCAGCGLSMVPFRTRREFDLHRQLCEPV